MQMLLAPIWSVCSSRQICCTLSVFKRNKTRNILPWIELGKKVCRSGFLSCYVSYTSCSAQQRYYEARDQCKVLLDISKEALDASSEETREKFNGIESPRVVWEEACKLARQNGTPEPAPDGVDMRGVEELRAELDTARAKLELNMNTDDGVVRQYEKRQEEVCYHRPHQPLTDRNFQIAQLERNIAQDKTNQARLVKKIDGARVRL